MRAHFVLWVPDQAAARDFYARVLERTPRLDVPGMTEIELDGAVLGLMPEAGIRRLLGDALPPIGTGARAELYLYVDDPAAHLARALEAGARELSTLAPRPWGDRAAYVLDPFGHVVAFAAHG